MGFKHLQAPTLQPHRAVKRQCPRLALGSCGSLSPGESGGFYKEDGVALPGVHDGEGSSTGSEQGTPCSSHGAGGGPLPWTRRIFQTRTLLDSTNEACEGRGQRLSDGGSKVVRRCRAVTSGALFKDGNRLASGRNNHSQKNACEIL